MAHLRLEASAWQDYQLIDSGNHRKLEQFGEYRLIRPEPQAHWKPQQANWDAHGQFENDQWVFRQPIPERWVMQYRDIDFWMKPTPFRHIGIFPEQAPHWDWLYSRVEAAKRPLHLLNLFGYTGIASLFAAKAGAKVTHVDSSKPAVAWARENQTLAKLDERPIRWVVEDASRYVEREVKRANRYDGIILDPPPFGHGPKGEVWKFKESLPVLLENFRQLWSDAPLLVMLTAYTTQSSLPELEDLIGKLTLAYRGSMDSGVVTLSEVSGRRALEPATFVRWEAE